MPIYYFNLRESGARIFDTDGTELADDVHAWRHAVTVAQELLRGRESATRHWLLEVENEGGELVLRLPFVAVDRSLMDLDFDSRRTVVRSGGARKNLAETFFHAQMTSHGVHAGEERMRGRPHLVAICGDRL